jgi:hypothetical protein
MEAPREGVPEQKVKGPENCTRRTRDVVVDGAA